jgi:hypothetical protein
MGPPATLAPPATEWGNPISGRNGKSSLYYEVMTTKVVVFRVSPVRTKPTSHYNHTTDNDAHADAFVDALTTLGFLHNNSNS